MSDTATQTIPDKLGAYTIVEHLASGGMAEIYLAEQHGPHGFRKRVVVKRIKSDHSGDPNFETMFLDEARLSSQLSHPHIVQTYELDHSGEAWFVAMEYIDGPTFEELLLRAEVAGTPVDPAVVIRIVSDVLAALTYAHDFVDHDGNHLEIVHRDVTPSNVLVSSAGVAKLADFGIAKAVGRKTETQTGAVKGKFGYMAPEQVEGGEVDPRTDLFAVGIMLYEALGGEKPFGEGLKAIHGVLQEDPEPLAEHAAHLPAPLCALVDRALKKAPAQRYPSAGDMLADLERIAREHQLLGTATDVVAKLGLSTSPDVMDPRGETVAANPAEALAMTEAVATEELEEPEASEHRGLPIAIVAIAILFIGIAIGLASLASVGGDRASRPNASNDTTAPTPAEIRDEQRRRIENMKPSNASPEERQRRSDEAKKLEERRREALEKARDKAKKKLEKELKRREKERGKGKGRGKH